MDQDAQNLETLKIFHYVFAGFTALAGFFPIIHLAMGIFFVVSGSSLGKPGEQVPPALFGWIFIVAAAVLMLAFWTLAGLTLTAARRLGQRRSRTFCLVVAAILCVMMPLGTVLGVFTILLLQKPTVRAMFGEQPA